MLQPLGHRVLVRPDAAPDESAGGLVLPEDRDHVPVSGQVVAVGPGGSMVKFKARQRALSQVLERLQLCACASCHRASEDVRALVNTPDPTHDLAVGDYVVFPAEVGHMVRHEGEMFILVNEDDVVAVEVA